MTPLVWRKNPISPRLLCYATVILAFHHCTGSQQSASRGRVLAFYRIAPCLNSCSLKALANEADTLLPMMFLELRKMGNICCGHKIRNIFCVPDTKFVSATNVARAGKRGNICVGNNVSATMYPRLPGPLRSDISSYEGVDILREIALKCKNERS